MIHVYVLKFNHKLTFKYIVKLKVSLGVPEIKSPFSNIILITLFVFLKKYVLIKKYIKIHIIIFKH